MIDYSNFYLPQETHPERLFVISELGDIKNKVILDLGCGRHKTIPEAIGIDITPDTDICCSMDNLSEFKNESVDIIISRHSLEHMLDPIKTLIEWGRVLRGGGRLIIILPDHGSVNTMDDRLSSGGLHLHAYTMESFSNLINIIKRFNLLKIGVVLKNWSFGAILEKY